MTVTKSNLIDIMALSAGITKVAADDALRAMLSAITAAVAQKHKVCLQGFGVFTLTKRRSRNGLNPRTLETLRIPAATVPKFTPGKAFKQAVRTRVTK